MSAGSRLAVARTLLFVPGNRPERFAKAAAARADAIVVDLEDAVAPVDKEQARVAAAAWCLNNPVTVVRVNAVHTTDFDEDMAAVRGAATRIMLPKAETAEDIAAVVSALGPNTQVLPLIETARGIANALTILSDAGVVRGAFGSIDFAAELGIDPEDRNALLLARSQLVLASHLAGAAPPLDGVTVAVKDLAQTASDTRYALSLGFNGKLCIHPDQVHAVHAAMLPADWQVTWARKVLSAGAEGDAVAVEGKMVDAPVTARARLILARAGLEEEVDFR